MRDVLSQADARALARSALGPAMLSYRDLAAHLAIGERTVKRWTAEGTLPAPDLRLRGIVRWRPATIDRWLARQAARASNGQPESGTCQT
jgi:excisionase family DNA binding protein